MLESSTGVNDMHPVNPYYRPGRNHSIREMIEESMDVDEMHLVAKLKRRYITSLDDEIYRIARGYQRLNQLYNPINGSRIQYARDIQYPN